MQACKTPGLEDRPQMQVNLIIYLLFFILTVNNKIRGAKDFIYKNSFSMLFSINLSCSNKLFLKKSKLALTFFNRGAF